MRTSLVLTTAAVLTPGVAVAAAVVVSHGHGPTVAHDAAFADVRTQVHAWADEDSTRVRLMVNGLPAGTYGAHVHVNPCGTDPLASGGHYQHAQATGSLQDREVWLDVTSDGTGSAVAVADVPWVLARGTAGSVVLHAQPTNLVTGAAGARLSCTTVAFGD
jgi:Cu-Zn family superoxide dismutase